MVCAVSHVDSMYQPSGMASPDTSSDGSAMGPAPYPQLCQVCEAPAQAQIPAALLLPRLYLRHCACGVLLYWPAEQSGF